MTSPNEEMREKELRVDLEAEIIPGLSAGGLILGTKREGIDNGLLASFEFEERFNKYLPDFPPLHVYSTKDIILYFEDGTLRQIGLTGNYNGKLASKLGLGNLVSDFEKEYGKMTEGDEDELIFTDLRGLCFEVDDSKYNSDNWPKEIPNLPVTEIYIFNK